MNIIDATKKAVSENRFISRPLFEDSSELLVKIKPSNDFYKNCEIMMIDGSNPRPLWSPDLDDILAENWRVTD